MTNCRCYVCGEIIGEHFALVAMSEGVDRVFVMHRRCAKQADNPVVVIHVATIPEPPHD